jgi:hypothetical protein
MGLSAKTSMNVAIGQYAIQNHDAMTHKAATSATATMAGREMEELSSEKSAPMKMSA